MRLDIHHHVDPSHEVLARLDAIFRNTDLILSNQETIMSALTDLQAAYATLHQTILDDISQENALLQRIADANAANDSDAIVALLRQATQDNADLQASIAKSKAATDAATANKTVVSGDTVITSPPNP